MNARACGAGGSWCLTSALRATHSPLQAGLGVCPLLVTRRHRAMSLWRRTPHCFHPSGQCGEGQAYKSNHMLIHGLIRAAF